MLVLETSSRVASRRFAQEQQLETRDMHARSAVPDTRWPQLSAPRVHSTLLSHPVLLYLRAMVPSHCSGSPLGGVTQTKCRALEPREKATDRNRDDRFEEREDDGTSRRGESYWFFRTSDRTRTRRRRRKKIGKRSPKKDSCWESERRKIFPFFSVLLFSGGLRWRLIPHLCVATVTA